jgi:Fe2+ transport system protein FeoA
MKLSALKPGRRAIVTDIEEVPVKMIEMGLMKGASVSLIRKSNFPKMLLVRLNGSIIAIPMEVADKINVAPEYEEERI